MLNQQYRLALDKPEVIKILNKECTLLIRDLNFFQQKMRAGDFIIGTETFGILESGTFIHQIGATEEQGVEIRHNGRWKPPFSLPSEHSRFKLEVRNLGKKLLKEISPEEFLEAGYRFKKDFMEAFNRRFDEHRWRLNEQPVTLIWFRRK